MGSREEEKVGHGGTKEERIGTKLLVLLCFCHFYYSYGIIFIDNIVDYKYFRNVRDWINVKCC